MIEWLQNHVWLCTYIIAGLAILTFVLNFIIKRNRNGVADKEAKNVKMKATHNTNSNVYQSAGDIIINFKKDESGQ